MQLLSTTQLCTSQHNDINKLLPFGSLQLERSEESKKHLMDQLGASNHGAELQDCRISYQAANADGSQTVITGMDAGLYKAAAEGKIDDLKKIEEHEFQVQLTPNHNTILHIAAQFGKLDCVQRILTLPSCSSLLQRPNLKGETPLHLAAREGHLEIVEDLIRTAKSLPVDIETGIGAEKVILRTKNKRKDTALHEAVRYGHSRVQNLGRDRYDSAESYPPRPWPVPDRYPSWSRNCGEDQMRGSKPTKMKNKSCILELSARSKKHACLFGSPKFSPEMELSDMRSRVAGLRHRCYHRRS